MLNGKSEPKEIVFVNSNGRSVPINVDFCTTKDIEKFKNQQHRQVSESTTLSVEQTEPNRKKGN